MAKHSPRIGEIARQAILDGLTNEQALAKVKKVHPEGRTNVQNMAWYRTDLRHSGLLVDAAARRRAARKTTRETFGTFQCAAIYPTKNGKVSQSGKLGETVGIKLTKNQAWKLTKALVLAIDANTETPWVDITAFRKGSRWTVTSIKPKR
jgi:hypothetical protein